MTLLTNVHSWSKEKPLSTNTMKAVRLDEFGGPDMSNEPTGSDNLRIVKLLLYETLRERLARSVSEREAMPYS